MDFLFTMMCGDGISFAGYCKKMNLKYACCFGSVDSFMSIPTWIQCFFSWALLVEQGTKFHYHCSLCGIYPTWISFDGVSLACPKRHIQWSAVDQIPNVTDPIKELSTHSVVKKNQLLLPSKEHRIQLQNFLTNAITNKVDFDALVTTLATTTSGINILLQYLYDTKLALSGKP